MLRYLYRGSPREQSGKVADNRDVPVFRDLPSNAPVFSTVPRFSVGPVGSTFPFFRALNVPTFRVPFYLVSRFRVLYGPTLFVGSGEIYGPTLIVGSNGISREAPGYVATALSEQNDFFCFSK
jgi:hypothetical protein